MSFFYIRQILTGDLGGVFYEQKTGKGFYRIKWYAPF